MDLKDVRICDPNLVEDLDACGATPIFNELLPLPAGCKIVGDLPMGASATAICTYQFDNYAQLQGSAPALMCLDTGICDDSYVNTAIVYGTGDYDDYCNPVGTEEISSTCSATISVSSECPRTKAKTWIWNENEVQFSGTERCITGWDEAWLLQWPVPNHFPVWYLGTDKGRARIDGMASDVCDDDDYTSINAPLLGIASSLHRFQFGANFAYARTGSELFGSGIEEGVLDVLDLSLNQNENDALGIPVEVEGDEPGIWKKLRPGAQGFPTQRVGPEDGDVQGPPDNPDRFLPPPPYVATTVQKGSLLVFPKFEIKWNAAGDMIQDTFIELSNDANQNVDLMIFLVNGQPPGHPRVCKNYVNNEVTLTNNEPLYWSLFTGQPEGYSPATVLGEPVPDPDPTNPGGFHLHGYLLVWAVNSDFQEINYNHLHGSATLVHYAHGEAWQYNPWAFQARVGAHGDPLAAPFGRLSLNGSEYDALPAMLHFGFFAPGAVLESGASRSVTVVDTDLTLWIGINTYPVP
jgi:hypothetical protein